ncbi:MAG TPA: type II toxin-antitoxin system VapC family toxin, partial [Thermodesulfobacteriota bacterium]
MIVVDTNVIAFLLIEGEHTAQAEGVFKKDTEWIAPYLWRSEFRSVLAFYVRKRRIHLDDAKALMQEAEVLMQGREFEVESARVLELAESSKCSAYDCEYVTLAEQVGVKLVTSDKKVLNAFSWIAMEMTSFSTKETDR